MIESYESKPRVVRFCGMVSFVLAAYYAFLIVAFYSNGLHHYTYDQIWAQQTPNATDFPFSGAPDLGLFGLLFLLIAMIIAGLGSFILPITAFVALIFLIYCWKQFNWREQATYLCILICSTPIVIVMWSSLGRSIATWIAD